MFFLAPDKFINKYRREVRTATQDDAEDRNVLEWPSNSFNRQVMIGGNRFVPLLNNSLLFRQE